MPSPTRPPACPPARPLAFDATATAFDTVQCHRRALDATAARSMPLPRVRYHCRVFDAMTFPRVRCHDTAARSMPLPRVRCHRDAFDATIARSLPLPLPRTRTRSACHLYTPQDFMDGMTVVPNEIRRNSQLMRTLDKDAHTLSA